MLFVRKSKPVWLMLTSNLNKGEYYCPGFKGDLLSELMWKKIVEEGFKNEWDLDDAIVVTDGSGSMYFLRTQ